jgi:predicted MFS family arabinose efflux permease
MIGGLLAKVMPYGAIFWVAAPIIAATGMSVLRIAIPPPTAPATRERTSLLASLATLRGRPELALLLGCAFLAALCQTQIFSALSLYAKTELHLSESQIGGMYSINGIGVLLLQIPAVAFIGALGASRALVGGSLLFALAFVGIGASGSFWPLGAAVFLLTIGEVLIAPAQQTTVADLAEPARMGRAFGQLGGMQMAGIAVAPLFGGFAYDHLRHDHMLMWGSVAATSLLLTIGYVVFAVVRRNGSTAAVIQPPPP